MKKLTALKISNNKAKKKKYTIAASQKEPIHTNNELNQDSAARSRNLPAINDAERMRNKIK